jgi:hypothetical protein
MWRGRGNGVERQWISGAERPTAMEAWASSAMGLLRAGKKKFPAALPEGGAKGRDGVVPCASSLGKEAARSNRGREPWLLGAPAPGEPGHGCPAQGRPGRRAPWEAPCSCARTGKTEGRDVGKMERGAGFLLLEVQEKGAARGGMRAPLA